MGGGKAIIPSAKKLGGPGATIDVPLHFKDAAFVRTHFDAMEVRLADAPRADEILVATTAGGVMPVTRLDGRIYGNDRPGPISARLRERYWKGVRAR